MNQEVRNLLSGEQIVASSGRRRNFFDPFYPFVSERLQSLPPTACLLIRILFSGWKNSIRTVINQSLQPFGYDKANRLPGYVPQSRATVSSLRVLLATDYATKRLRSSWLLLSLFTSCKLFKFWRPEEESLFAYLNPFTIISLPSHLPASSLLNFICSSNLTRTNSLRLRLMNPSNGLELKAKSVNCGFLYKFILIKTWMCVG